MPHIDDNSTYFSFQERKDANGKRFIKALAHGDLTAHSPYVVYKAVYGYKTAAIFDVGQTPGSAAGLAKFHVGFPPEAVGSGTRGWLQIEGYIASATTGTCSGSLGSYLRWTDTTCLNSGVSSLSGTVADFAVIIDTTSDATAHNLILLGDLCCGTT